MTLLETSLGKRGCGPLICNSLIGKLKLERIDSTGENRLSWGILLFVGGINPVEEDI